MKDFVKELRGFTDIQLHEELLSLRKKQFSLRMKKASGTLDKTHEVSQIRKAIAQIKTIMSEKVGKSDD
ncbi:MULTISPECIES: 50S ribosomal protein L29 [Legionella]|uniref:Large ribosomal subunit protein uL29 n=1 Tax=Legionella drozanskii LLAP-1 TaxID=1212489 RepID=A0A0W0T8J9_9GAMM|nr:MULTISPECIES: 50S ribosomal protein L29 [Legionella]KTC91840.1 50S ribosomal protein L29 [Legionella drozanskii LLAP-1]PJE18067.1 MAG: 50S ribosomal protein L29 [Legionella sp.]